MTAPDLSPADLAAIQARADAATEGPWEFDGNEIETVPDYASDNPAPWKQVLECEVGCGSYCYGGRVDMTIAPADRDFIAHARTDVPALLALVREQAAAIERVRVLANSSPDAFLGRSILAALTATEGAQ